MLKLFNDPLSESGTPEHPLLSIDITKSKSKQLPYDI